MKICPIVILFSLLIGCNCSNNAVQSHNIVGRKVCFAADKSITGIVAEQDWPTYGEYKVVYFDKLGVRHYDYVKSSEILLISSDELVVWPTSHESK